MGKGKDRRVQALFTADEYDLLADHAALASKSISAVVREAVEENLIKELRRRRRIEAANWLCSGGDEFPARDWSDIEADLDRSRFAGCP